MLSHNTIITQPLFLLQGINKAVILGMVDTMLANKEVNIWWLPDQIERIIYCECQDGTISACSTQVCCCCA